MKLLCAHLNLTFMPYMMSVVGKWTCSGFKTGLHISYHGGIVVRYIKETGYLLKDGQISGHFGTKYMAVLQIEQILHNFEEPKIANFFNLEQVNFRVTLVILLSALELRSFLPHFFFVF